MTGATRLSLLGALASWLAVLPLIPITETTRWLIPATLAIGLLAGIGWVLRRTKLPGALIPLCQLAVLTWWLGLLVATDAAWMAIVPTPSWVERLMDVAREGADTIMFYPPPVPVDRGLTFAIVAGVGLIAIGVELAVFGLRRVPLAGLALAVMYAIAASVARDGWSWFWFVPPAVGFLALLVGEGRSRVARWGRSVGQMAPQISLPATDSLARSGRRVGVVAIAAAVAVPAWVPELTDGLIDGGGGSGAGSGRTIRTDNPIVDLQRDLVRPDNVPILRYVTDAPRPEYIRTATLDIFDGEEWGLSQRDVPESQRVDEGLPWPPGLGVSDNEDRFADYHFEISDNFGSRWLPLAYPAQEIDIRGDWRYDRTTLDVVSPDHDVQGIGYSATSMVVDRDASRLREASRTAEDASEMLELPDGMRDELADYIAQAIGDTTNPHKQAVALQDWFRSDGGFSYSLEREPGTSSSALLDFLNARVGYCEQYAATMAIMARAIGIPARVAVGFTPGEELEDGSWLVRAHDSHAWPELYFEGTGWIRFEPTPAVRTGSAPAWTLAPPDENDEPGTTTEADGSSSSEPGDDETEELGELPLDEAGGFGGPVETPWWQPVAIGAGLLALVLALPSLAARAVRAVRWRRALGDPVAEAEAAWSDFRDAVRDAGLSWDPAATPRGTRRRVSDQVNTIDFERLDGAELMDHLVITTERARYAARAEPVPHLRHDAALLRDALLRSQPRARRLGAWLAPAVLADAIRAAGAQLADGLTWLDNTGERLRARFERGH